MASFAYIYGRAGKRVGFHPVFSGKKSTVGAVPAVQEAEQILLDTENPEVTIPKEA